MTLSGQDNEVLNIKSFDVEDEGIYICVAINQDTNELVKNHIEVSIQKHFNQNIYKFSVKHTLVTPNLELKYSQPLSLMNVNKKLEIECITSGMVCSSYFLSN